MNLSTNPQIDLAFDYVRYTNKLLFLTGKAGTGKTTFLHRVQQEINKRMAVVAPTGVAAINAKGVTIHSLFQLPFGPLVPSQGREEMKHRRFTRKKINLIKSLDLLVIDEISMVRADVLDAIDAVLRRYRRSKRAFGGVQLLMIGDLHQLPPVVKPQEWDLLRDHYQTPYFFGSQALQQAEVVTIELKHIYRQSDSQFIELLNRVRSNRLDEEVLHTINSRYQADFEPEEAEGYITLTSHNATAQTINAKKLDQLDGKPYTFQAQIDGDFPEHAYPTEVELEFKEAAQVMFVKNDLTADKRYYNGKIGHILRIDKGMILVQCPDDDEPIEVTPVEWHNRKYALDEQSKEVREDLIGTFTQFPLKLAWAITIHKSQGLTFERVVIDAQSAFAHGQVYVALSRCKTFAGIVLRTQIEPTSVKTDRVIRNYTEETRQNEPGTAELEAAKRAYQADLLRELFDFSPIAQPLYLLYRAVLENESVILGNAPQEVAELKEVAEEKIVAVAKKFGPQLNAYLAQAIHPTENEPLQKRCQQAIQYFLPLMETGLIHPLKNLEILTDNQAIDQRVQDRLAELETALRVKQACLTACETGFDAQRYIRAKIDAELAGQPKRSTAKIRSAAPQDIEHPELYQRLAQWRADTADEKGVPRYTILPTKTILELVAVLPTDPKNLQRIHGIGKSRVQQYGAELMDIIMDYCAAHQLPTDQLQFITGKPPKAPKPPKPDTKAISLELFRSGKSIPEIAETRGFVTSTIEGHLAHFIGLGELDVFELLAKEKVEKVAQFFGQNSGGGLTEAKQHFGTEFGFGELKMIKAYMTQLEA